jgi:hypothetical protein
VRSRRLRRHPRHIISGEAEERHLTASGTALEINVFGIRCKNGMGADADSNQPKSGD